MKLIIGLGNPDKEYEGTFHNVGFRAINALALHYGVVMTKKDCKALCGDCIINGEKVIFAKPQTYMNLSGTSVLDFKNKYKIDTKNMFVFSDDIDLPLGKFRFRETGSAGTHNGLKNIVSLIGQDFNRIRIGVGRDEKFTDLADFVLSKIPAEKEEIIDNTIDSAIELISQKLEN